MTLTGGVPCVKTGQGACSVGRVRPAFPAVLGGAGTTITPPPPSIQQPSVRPPVIAARSRPTAAQNHHPKPPIAARSRPTAAAAARPPGATSPCRRVTRFRSVGGCWSIQAADRSRTAPEIGLGVGRPLRMSERQDREARVEVRGD